MSFETADLDRSSDTRRQLTETDRVLVVRLGAIGDVLRVLPSVRRLRLASPRTTIGWAVEDWVAPALEGNPNVDHLHVLRRRHTREGGLGAVREVLRFTREIRERRYRVVLDFHGRLKSGLVSRMSGARTRIGYARGFATEGNHLFTNVHVRLDDPLENRVLRFLRLLGPLGIEAVFDPADTGLYVSPETQSAAANWYLHAGRPPLAVYPGTSTMQARYHRWPAEKWTQLLRRLARDGVASVVFWGPDDADYSRQIATAAGSVLAPETTLPQMMATLANFAAFVGTNTAAMHMAWLQGVPTAMFTGPALRRTDAPLGCVPQRTFRADDEFRPGRSKRHQPYVVRAVSVDEVYDGVRALLSSPAVTASGEAASAARPEAT